MRRDETVESSPEQSLKPLLVSSEILHYRLNTDQKQIQEFGIPTVSLSQPGFNGHLEVSRNGGTPVHHPF